MIQKIYIAGYGGVGIGAIPHHSQGDRHTFRGVAAAGGEAGHNDPIISSGGVNWQDGSGALVNRPRRR